MSKSIKRVRDLIDFFENTDRRCIVIWQRNLPGTGKTNVGVLCSHQADRENLDFALQCGNNLRNAASDMLSRLDEQGGDTLEPPKDNEEEDYGWGKDLDGF
jgi:adenylylsulfate kinase-like enzyme